MFRKIRPGSKTIGNFPGGLNPQMAGEEDQLFVEARLNQGMITIVDPADIPTGAVQEALNQVIRFDRFTGRDGTVQLSFDGASVVPNPDQAKVMAVRSFNTEDGTGYTFRITPNNIYLLSGNNNWIPLQGISHAGTPGVLLNGGLSDRITSTIAFDVPVIANNGVNAILSIDPVGQTYSPLFNSAASTGTVLTSADLQYRYVTSFYNRVIGAALVGNNEVQVGWSGQGRPILNPDNDNLPSGIWQWDPSIDFSAGSSPIEDSPSDYSDLITGIHGFTNVMVLMRQRSIWLATKQPVATNPFNFFAFVPGIGSNCPHSQQIVDNGVAFLDQETGTAYYFSPGVGTQPIGRPIENTIFNGLNDLGDIFSSYDPFNKDYHIYIPQVASSTVLRYTYNFKSQGWTRGEYESIGSADNSTLTTGQLTFNELQGTYANLQGTFNDLVRVTTELKANVFGRVDGGIMVEQAGAVDDNAIPIAFNQSGVGIPIQRTLILKDFEIPKSDAYWSKFIMRFIQLYSTNGFFFYNKTTGALPIDDSRWVQGKEISGLPFEVVQPDGSIGFGIPEVPIGIPYLFNYVQTISASRISFRIDMEGPGMSVLGYEIWYKPGGPTRPAGVNTQ